MNPFHATVWPTTLAQADTTPAPARAPVDTSPPPAAATDGDATTQTPGTPGGNGTTGADGAAPAPSPFGGSFMFLMILMIGLLFIFTMSSGRKEKKRKAEMLASLSKGAKVQTVGGVLGTIVEVRDDEVVVKVDENSNTRMRFAKTAIGSVTADD